MRYHAGVAAIFIGVIIGFWGAMMPGVVETTVTSCYTDAWGYRHCADAVGARDNTFRPVVIAVGILTVVVGIYLIDDTGN